MDDTLQVLKEMVLSGWTAEQSRVPEKLKKYWTFREEIGLLNRILYKRQKIKIPKSMRKEMLKKIHSSHLGIESCTRKAKDLIFWPEMYKDIIEMVPQCHVCAKYSRNKNKEPLQIQNIPNWPWSKLAIDQFSFNGINYIVTVDYYSDYFEIDRLHVTTSSGNIKALKKHFAKFGIPEEIITDNGPNFVSQEFATFKNNWDIRHITSSPYHSQGNRKAESAVKITKQLMRKAKETKSDVYVALMDWRNTPTVNMDSSPVQRLMQKRTRTLIPTSEKLLEPEVCRDVKQKQTIKRQLAIL